MCFGVKHTNTTIMYHTSHPLKSFLFDCVWCLHTKQRKNTQTQHLSYNRKQVRNNYVVVPHIFFLSTVKPFSYCQLTWYANFSVKYLSEQLILLHIYRANFNAESETLICVIHVQLFSVRPMFVVNSKRLSRHQNSMTLLHIKL